MLKVIVKSNSSVCVIFPYIFVLISLKIASHPYNLHKLIIKIMHADKTLSLAHFTIFSSFNV